VKAVILAAGVGRRLGILTRDRPKCLIELGGRSLLLRYLDALSAAGLKNATIIVGYKQEAIRAAVGNRHGDLGISYVVNNSYERGSLYSLWLARGVFDDDLLIMDADVLCPASFITRLIRSPHPNAILIDETVQHLSEERIAVVRGGRVVALTKTVPPGFTRSNGPAGSSGQEDLLGEGVGFLKITQDDTRRMLEAMEPYVRREALDMEYEDTWEAFFQAVTVGYEKIGGQPWIEIDFPEDIERAERDVLPRL
jgi:choline kinase